MPKYYLSYFSHGIDKNSVSAKIKTEPIKINKQTAYLLLIQKPTD